ncbi:DUF6440 family protein [Jeotgalibaca dankookensis]|uniref:DUF6440 family protein n=1 Tax=Jeotgalibaca dankookensis TaxID=708126 RepID=UPI0007813D5E|nr:DUF6440 family protein [Jeotgalibaca dankookensis]
MSKENKNKGNKRFEVIEKEGFEPSYEVVRDNKTGVLYMVYNSLSGIGMTLLVDQMGNPLIDDNF